MRRVGRGVLWLTVVALAALTTAGAVAAWPGGLAARCAELGPLGRGGAYALTALVALAPWWALVAVLVGRDRGQR